MIAALFVQRGGVYFGIPGVDPWDERRDARQYPGPWPVVAHPPCARWSMLAAAAEKCYGRRRGEDGGCFASALAAVRRWGGVLEHPAETAAWPAFGLPRPSRTGGWERTPDGGWVCWVEQGHYGHPAAKPTWLYVAGVDSPPDLRWGPCADATCTVCELSGKGGRRSRTPGEFRGVLLSIARQARPASSEVA